MRESKHYVMMTAIVTIAICAGLTIYNYVTLDMPQAIKNELMKNYHENSEVEIVSVQKIDKFKAALYHVVNQERYGVALFTNKGGGRESVLKLITPDNMVERADNIYVQELKEEESCCESTYLCIVSTNKDLHKVELIKEGTETAICEVGETPSLSLFDITNSDAFAYAFYNQSGGRIKNMHKVSK